MHYRWMKEDSAYPALFAEAKAKAVQSWEDEAVRRANEGVFEPTVWQGQFTFPVIGFKRDAEGRSKSKPIHSRTPYGVMKLSDRLLEMLLKANKPEVYREPRTVEITGAGGGPIEIVERLNAARKRVAKPAEPNISPGE